MKLFKANIGINITKDYKPEKNLGSYVDKQNEYNSKGNGKLAIEQYLEKFKPYLHDMMVDLRTYRNHLRMKINFIPCKGSDEKLSDAF